MTNFTIYFSPNCYGWPLSQCSYSGRYCACSKILVLGRTRRLNSEYEHQLAECLVNHMELTNTNKPLEKLIYKIKLKKEKERAPHLMNALPIVCRPLFSGAVAE